MRKYNLQRKPPDESVAEKLETLVKDGHSPFYKFKKDGAHVFTNVKRDNRIYERERRNRLYLAEMSRKLKRRKKGKTE